MLGGEYEIFVYIKTKVNKKYILNKKDNGKPTQTVKLRSIYVEEDVDIVDGKEYCKPWLYLSDWLAICKINWNKIQTIYEQLYSDLKCIKHDVMLIRENALYIILLKYNKDFFKYVIYDVIPFNKRETIDKIQTILEF